MRGSASLTANRSFLEALRMRTSARQGLRGTDETRAYYDREGWTPSSDGAPRDLLLWGGGVEQGPIRRSTHALRRRRVIDALSRAGTPLDLLECGCGGNPATDLLEVCASYTGLDFSSQGLATARGKLQRTGTPFDLVEGDMCSLPFEDESFDAVYSSHALYHIRDPRAQATAIREMARVLRPGGVLVLVVANPRPLLFPVRMMRRLVADTPVIGTLAEQLRSPGPIPYNPRPLGWMRRELGRHGRVQISGYTLPSVWFNKKITEHRAPGRLAWQSIAWLERTDPEVAGPLGCYVQITMQR